MRRLPEPPRVSQAGWKGNGAGRPQRWRARSAGNGAAPEFALSARHQRQGSLLVSRPRPAGSSLSRAQRPWRVRCGERRKGCEPPSSRPTSSRTLAGSRLARCDCRFELGKPELASLPGAPATSRAPCTWISSAIFPAPVTPRSGRHPLPAPADFAATLSRLGIGNDTRVRLLRRGLRRLRCPPLVDAALAGSRRVAVLDGGFAAWVAKVGLSRPTSRCRAAPAEFVPRTRPAMVLDAAGVLGALARGESLVDVRGAERFSGKVEPLDAVAGHVPGAVNLPTSRTSTRAGRFRASAELAELWRSRTGAAAGRAPICMCGSGVTACQGLLALEAAGLAGGRLYAGSWSEWIRDPARPVARAT